MPYSTLIGSNINDSMQPQIICPSTAESDSRFSRDGYRLCSQAHSHSIPPSSAGSISSVSSEHRAQGFGESQWDRNHIHTMPSKHVRLPPLSSLLPVPEYSFGQQSSCVPRTFSGTHLDILASREATPRPCTAMSSVLSPSVSIGSSPSASLTSSPCSSASSLGYLLQPTLTPSPPASSLPSGTQSSSMLNKPRPYSSSSTFRLIPRNQVNWSHYNPKKTCSVCGRNCTRPSTLKTHMLIHTGELPFECSWHGCGRRFNVRSNMKRHLNSHKRKFLRQQKNTTNDK